MAVKKILVCCGTSMITSSVVIKKLQPTLDKEDIQARFNQCKYSDVPVQVNMDRPDVIIPTGKLSESAAGGVPVVEGSAFLTGVSLDKTIEKIIEILKSE